MTAKPIEPNSRISVVIPVLNEAGHIGECLGSVQGQTYPADLVEIVGAQLRGMMSWLPKEGKKPAEAPKDPPKQVVNA